MVARVVPNIILMTANNPWRTHDLKVNRSSLINNPLFKMVLNSHPNSKIDNYKSEDGNGPILLLKELVLVLEEDIVLLYQELLSLFSEVIITQEKLKAILILMIPMFLTLMQTNSQYLLNNLET